jgi:hypothetical protein
MVVVVGFGGVSRRDWEALLVVAIS